MAIENIKEKFKTFLIKVVIPNKKGYSGWINTNNIDNRLEEIEVQYEKAFGVSPFLIDIANRNYSISVIKENLKDKTNQQYNKFNANAGSGIPNAILNTHLVAFIQNNLETAHNKIMENTEKTITRAIPLNQILFGPPGTGKTYNSIDKTIEIVSPETHRQNSRKLNKKIFDELRKQGQIEFVTFHQNYTYEDFMIGIRPNVDEGVKELTFKNYTGIFYEIAQRARGNYENSLKDEQTISKENWVRENFEEFKEYVQTEIEEKGKFEIINKVSIYSVEDKVFIYTGEKENGELWQNQRIGMHYDALINMYLADVKSRKDVKQLNNVPPLEKQHSTYSFELIQKFRKFLTLNNYTFQNSVFKKEPLKNYVLVIDEINRANISKVFGELITLLEDDKRLGKENELKITLPNGEKEFGIPPNLYLIGTMNTADKSIALIDIALRRRFEFVGYYPKYEVLDNTTGALLQQINATIFEKKKTADYLIGHAYFMKGQPIEIVLLNKVIPLLMEYFSGKTDVVESVFANTLYDVNYNTSNYSWSIVEK